MNTDPSGHLPGDELIDDAAVGLIHAIGDYLPGLTDDNGLESLSIEEESSGDSSIDASTTAISREDIIGSKPPSIPIENAKRVHLTDINDLPNEMLKEILGHLPQIKRKGVSRVSWMWDYLFRTFKDMDNQAITRYHNSRMLNFFIDNLDAEVNQLISQEQLPSVDDAGLIFAKVEMLEELINYNRVYFKGEVMSIPFVKSISQDSMNRLGGIKTELLTFYERSGGGVEYSLDYLAENKYKYSTEMFFGDKGFILQSGPVIDDPDWK